ncbi:hypothetical protein F5878DRAFT_614618 [Lentinula raphanica]|uniref:Uncharacterized protein n=1 Tax=Lentinula raphanica TaxID=153919 RepID=A0AA38PBS1_9AGAR|nr:hypothetical protein F5878DRAFT_614618 [Lentinula raphanica]
MPRISFVSVRIVNEHHHRNKRNSLQTEAFSISERQDILERANNILTDVDLWPLGQTKFYLGLFPPSRVSNPSKTVEAVHTRSRILSMWHGSIICLTGRIWGEYKTRTRSSESRRLSMYSFRSFITLSSILYHLISCFPFTLSSLQPLLTLLPLYYS